MIELFAKFLPEWIGGVIIGAALLFITVWLATPEMTQRAYDLHIAARCEQELKSKAQSQRLVLDVDPKQPCTCAMNRERSRNVTHALYIFSLGYVRSNSIEQKTNDTNSTLSDSQRSFRTHEFSFVDFLGERTASILYSGACGEMAGFFLDPVEEARKQQQAALLEQAARQAAEAERIRLRLQSEALKVTEPLMEVFGQMFREYGR